METICDDKTFFRPGDVVTLNKDIPNKPIMIVVRKETNFYKDEYSTMLLRGIRCRWFSSDGKLQEATWSTKDLTLIK